MNNLNNNKNPELKRKQLKKKLVNWKPGSKELMSWSNQEGRDKVRNAKVVYIYHDTIDAIGDKLSTEEKNRISHRARAFNKLKEILSSLRSI